jgi:hypothetical protein
VFSDFLRVIKESGATEFTGYGISVRFAPTHANFSSSFTKTADSPVPISIGLRAEPDNENPWNNPNLWSGQQGKRLRLDGSLG